MFRRFLCILVLVVGYSFLNTDCTANNLENKADFVIYSFNRPLQLYALLESVDKYMTGLGEICVIYRATQESYALAYDEVKKDFGQVIFMQQGDKPYEDFQPLTLQAVFSSPHVYIIFAVDDIVVKDFIDIASDITLLEKTQAYGFYYRLGKNLSYCYTMQRAQAIPPLQVVADGVFAWQFCQAECDWGYPNTVDMTLYRKADIRNFFETVPYEAPNPLEGRWSGYAYQVSNRIGLCYEQSKIINLPLNCVQNFCNNAHMGGDTQVLLNEFNEGKKIDINILFRIPNISAHQEYVLTYLPR